MSKNRKRKEKYMNKIKGTEEEKEQEEKE